MPFNDYLTEEIVDTYLSNLRVISNETRFRILNFTYHKGKITWTQMDDDLGINPNMIRHHTQVLLKHDFLRKSYPYGFELTKKGGEMSVIFLSSGFRLFMELRELEYEHLSEVSIQELRKTFLGRIKNY